MSTRYRTNQAGYKITQVEVTDETKYFITVNGERISQRGCTLYHDTLEEAVGHLHNRARKAKEEFLAKQQKNLDAIQKSINNL